MIFKVIISLIILKFIYKYIKDNTVLCFLSSLFLFNFILNKISFSSSFISLIIIILLDKIINYLTNNYKNFYLFFNSDQIEIIENGKINFKNLKRSNITLEELAKNLGLINIEDIQSCMINSKNELTIIKNKLSSPISIIVNGNINYFNLKQIKKDIKWLNFILIKRKLSLQNISYAFYFNNNIYFINNKHFF